ncbi:MAG TPA: tRNA pseudouridine(55) synthase TruB [Candidatus Aquicultor sp.]|jgi:tRNA pseudouridine55 synthase
MMDGILVIDKPAGKTSHDIVNVVRKRTGIRKVGHTGTLDPMATGVLVMLIGKATRIARFLELEPKEYVAQALFGTVTDSQDITGNIVRESHESVDIEKLIKLIPQFTGSIVQIPPMVSAIKVGGTPLYKLARQGKEVERTGREITIYELEMLDHFERDSRTYASFRVVCSGGTYVRTLLHDIGEALGVGATLSSLRRTRVGRYSLVETLELDDIDGDMIISHVLGMDDALSHLAAVVVKNDIIQAVLNGRTVDSSDLEPGQQTPGGGDFVRLKSPDNRLLAIGVMQSTGAIKPEIVFS